MFHYSPADQPIELLRQLGNDRLQQTWRPSTWAQYNASWNRFSAFCDKHQLQRMDCPMSDFIAYTQYLIYQKLSTATIKKHISALRTMFKWYGVNKHLWIADSWTWNLKSLSIATRVPTELRSVVRFEHFVHALCMSETLGWYDVKISFILGFLGLLRISNMAPESTRHVDLTSHTLLHDVSIIGTDLVIRIKWAKNI